MDTFEWTKIGGAFCGALLFFLLLNWGTEIIYHSGQDGYGEDKLAYYLDIEVSTEEKEESSEEIVDFSVLLASADIEKGKKVFGKCKSCHKLDNGANGVGPHLYKVVNRDIGSIEGFKYSKALLALEGAWSVEELNKYLTKPTDYAPGTAMNFAGLKKDKDRADLIEYLKTLSE
jgi:cytochrome c